MLKFAVNKFLYIILTIIFIFAQNFSCLANDEEIIQRQNEEEKKYIDKCLEDLTKNALIVGWNDFTPYQYQIIKSSKKQLVGLDIAIIKYLSKKIGYNLEFHKNEWSIQQNKMTEGTQDIILGATYNNARAQDSYFSLPYRNEENSLFLNENNNSISDFENIAELLTQIRSKNFKIGSIKENIYQNLLIQNFLENNQDIVKNYNNVAECIIALEKGQIDGFITERIFGAYALMHNTYNFKEILIPQSTPIHIMFSKKTVPVKIVQKFNQEIKNFIATDAYKIMVKNYLYSSLFNQAIHSHWFNIIAIIGLIGFTISGFCIATKSNMTLFKSCLIAIIPSSLGLLVKDLLINNSKDGTNFSLDYIFFFLGTIGILYCIILIIQYLKKRNDKPSDLIVDFLSNLIVIGDSIGKSCFFSIGVGAGMILQINPIIIVPIAGIISSHLGLAGRNFIIKQMKNSDELDIEVTFIWSIILTLYCSYYFAEMNSNKVQFILCTTIIGCFITQLLTHYLKIPNVKLTLFRNNISSDIK
jgi:polar amino acid transport system substrate-binding protein